MSNLIDNKIVSMEFDNSKFEKPAEQSISTLDKLKDALKFKNVEAGFDAMQTAIKKVTFRPLEKGIESVYAKFTFLERFTVQLYDRLSNKIINMGIQMGQALFTTPRKTGMSEYEEKMDAISLMVNSTGKDLSYINKKLEELNVYADKTIYSFSDMTNNIGKFTNAGVDLDTAVNAIKGVSNVAALAGSTSAQASRAMYNFSQALGLGSVRLQDWMSIENANMATVEFKNALIDMGLQLKTLQKDENGVITTTKGTTVTMENFRNSLQDSWLTTDVLTSTLSRFSDETDKLGQKAYKAATEVKTFSMLIDTLKEALQSGWSQSWEYIIGDFDQAKKLWTNLSNVLGGLIDKMAKARNTMLKFWSEMGGREAIIKSFINVWRALTSILSAVRDGFRAVFPPKTGEDLRNLSLRIEAFTKKLKPSIATTDKLRQIFAGFFNAIGIVIDGLKALVKSFKRVFSGAVGEGTNKILTLTASFANWVSKLRETIKESKIFERVFTGIAIAIKTVSGVLIAAFRKIIDIINAFRTGGIEAGFKAIKNAFVNMVEGIYNYIKSKKPIEAVKKLGIKIANVIEKWPVTRAIKNFLMKIWDFLKSNPITSFIIGLFEGLVGSVKNIIGKFASISVKPIGKLTDKMKEQLKPLEKVKNFFVKIFDGIIWIFKKTAPIFKTVGEYLGKTIKRVFSALGGIIQRSDLGDVGQLIMGIGIAKGASKSKGVFSSLGTLLTSISNIGSKAAGVLKEVSKTLQSFQRSLDAKALFNVSKAIALLAAALVVLSIIPKDDLVKASAIIVELFAALTISLRSIAKAGSKTGTKGSVGVASMAAMIVALGVAVLFLSGAVAILAHISYENLMKGLLGIIIVLKAISSFIKTVGKEKRNALSVLPILGMVALITAIATSLLILTIAAKIDKDGLLNSIKAMSIVLLAIGVLYYIIAKSSKWSTALATFPIAAISSLILSIAASLFILTLAAKIDKNSLTTSILAMIAVIGVIALLYSFIQKNTSVFKSPVSIFPILGIIGILVTLSLSLSILSLATRKNPESLAASTTAIITALIAVVAAYVLLNKKTSKLAILKTAPIVSFIVGIAAISLVLALLTKAADKNPEGFEKALLGIISLIGALVIASALISKFKLTNNIKVAPIIALALAVALLALPIMIMVKGLKETSEISDKSQSIAIMNNLGLVLIALGAIYLVIKELSKKIKTKELAKAILGVSLLTVLLGGIVAMLIKMKKVQYSSIAKLSLLLAAIAAIALIASAAASIKAVKTGLEVLSKSFLIFASGVAVLSAAVSLLLITLRSFASMSSDEIDAIGKAIASLADVINKQKKNIAMAVGGLIGAILESLIETLKQSLDSLLKGLMDILNQVFDFLIENAPVIIDKLIKLIIVILEGIERNADRLINKLVLAVMAIFKGVTKALKEHGKELLDLVSELLDQIAGLVSAFVVKVIGIAGTSMGAFLQKIVKFAIPLLLVLEIFNKFKDAIKSISTIGKVFGFFKKDKLKEVADGVEKVTSKTGGLKKAVSALFGVITAHPFIALLAAVAIAAAAVTSIILGKKKTVTDADIEIKELTKDLKEEELKYQEALKQRSNALKTVDQEVNTTESLIKKLRDCVDQNGKIKKGYESRVDFLKKQLNAGGVFQVEIDAQSKILSLIDQQNNKLDIQGKKVKETMKRQALRSKLEALQNDVEAKRVSLVEELPLKLADAKNKLAEYGERVGSIKGIGENLTYKDINDLNIELQTLRRLNGEGKLTVEQQERLAKLTAQQNPIAEIASHYADMENAVGNIEKIVHSTQAEVDNYDAAFTALDGSIDDVEKATAALDRNLMLSKSGTSLLEVQSQMLEVKKEYESLIKSGIEISEETEKYYSDMFSILGDDLTSYGNEGKEFLDKIGYKTGKSYIEQIRKGIKDEQNNNEWAAWIHYKLMFRMGQQQIEGLIKGLKDKYDSLETAYKTLGEDGMIAYAKELGIMSPSKEFEKFGVYEVLGLINGVTKKESMLNKTYTAMAASNIAAYASAMSSEQSTIPFTPVFNTNGIQNGTSMLQGQLNSLTSNPIGATLTSKLAASVDTSKIDSDNSKIVQSLSALQEKVQSLSDNMLNLQIVMDTGATVGALAPAMDTELGRRTTRKLRGV